MSEQSRAMEFPCRFPIKAIGSGSDLDELVYNIICRHVADLGKEAVTTRSSGKGNYMAVTVTITAESRHQLDRIYLDLTAHERIHFAL